MKVSSGIYGSRKLVSKEGLTTRPTLDKVKQAIFNIIGNSIIDATFLDLFSGSGQIGIEAISRSSKKVYFNDSNYEAYKIIQTNINNLGIEKEKYELTKKDYKKCLKEINDKLDIIFLDPPYKKIEFYKESLALLKQCSLLKPSSIIICEANKDMENIQIDGFNLKEYKYGNCKVLVFKPIS